MVGPAPIDPADRRNVAQMAWTDHEGQGMAIGEQIKELRGERQWPEANLATKIAGAGQISGYEDSHIAPREHPSPRCMKRRRR